MAIGLWESSMRWNSTSAVAVALAMAWAGPGLAQKVTKCADIDPQQTGEGVAIDTGTSFTITLDRDPAHPDTSAASMELNVYDGNSQNEIGFTIEHGAGNTVFTWSDNNDFNGFAGNWAGRGMNYSSPLPLAALRQGDNTIVFTMSIQ